MGISIVTPCRDAPEMHWSRWLRSRDHGWMDLPLKIEKITILE